MAIGMTLKARRGLSWLLASLLVVVLSGPASEGSAGQAVTDCPPLVDPDDLADVAQLREWTEKMGSFAPNRSGDPNQNAYVDWLEAQFTAVPGMTVESMAHEPFDDVAFNVDQTAPFLSVMTSPSGEWEELPVATPSSRSSLTTPDGVTADVIEVPYGVPLDRFDVEGKIVLREFKFDGRPMLDFYVASTYIHDPELTFAQREDTRPTGTYRREYLGGGALISLNAEARNAGAAGLLIALEFPRDQMQGLWMGQNLDMPGVFLGAQEAKHLREALVQGPVTARITVEGELVPHHSRSLRATLPGTSDELVVFQTHTDTMNELQENGSVGLLAIAHYASTLPAECRRKTLEFELSAGHRSPVRGRTPAAERLVEEQDRLALVMGLEHLGALEHIPIEQEDGLHRLEPTGLPEGAGFMIPDNPVMHEIAVEQTIVRDLRRTFVLPAVALGEAKAFANRGLPTAQIIAGPWTLHAPSFGMEQIDFDVMRNQILVAGDLYRRIDDLPPEVVATMARCGPTSLC